jgi:hypothetical protein
MVSRKAGAAARVGVVGAVVAAALAACGGGSSSSTTPPCDSTCQDSVALRSLRDGIKLAYNLALQGQPVGPQNATAQCPLGGSVRVAGTATSNASVGSTTVSLTYFLTACGYSQTDTDPNQTYSVTVDGVVTESGTIAQVSTSTTALDIGSTSFSLTGTVYSPGIDYTASACALEVGQNGNELSGTMCGRSVGVTLK